MYGKDVTDRKEKIQRRCEERLQHLYPAGLPDEIRVRYENELECATESDSIDLLYAYYILSDEAKRLEMPLILRGDAGSSILVYLLGNSLINPVRAYYYCVKCGHFEYIEDCYYGMDAADMACPKCKHPMRKDGFSLDERFAWGSKTRSPKQIYMEYNIVSGFLPFARRRLMEEYHDLEVIRAALDEWEDGEYTGKKSDTGFVVLPPGKHLMDYPEQTVYMKDGEPGFYAPHYVTDGLGIFRVMLLSNPLNEKIYEMQMKTGIFNTDIRQKDIAGYIWRDILNTGATFGEDEYFAEYTPHSYYEMAEIISASHNTWEPPAGEDVPEEDRVPAWKEMKESGLFEKNPFYSRNALLHLLEERGIDEEEAFRFMEFVRKGKARRDPRWDELLEEIDIPTDMRLACEGYRYLWSQSHSLEYLLGYAQCAFYQKFNGRLYEAARKS